jgi:hypothetical protein
MRQRLVFSVALAALAACGGPQRGAEPDTQPLGQARAIELVEEAVASREVGATTTNVPATLSNGTEVNVDVLVRALGAGYLYLNEQDRRDYGPVPERAEGSELHAVLGALEGGEQVHLLVLQDEDYAYLPNPRADRRDPDEVTIDYVEARIRRDCLDFVQAIIDLRGAAE